MEPSLYLLVQKRDYDFSAFTRKIIASFSEKLTKAVHMFQKTDRAIRWNRIEAYDQIDGFVVVVGSVEIRVGDMLQTREGEVLMTEENIDNFTNTVRFFVHSNKLQNASLEEFYQHLCFVVEITQTLPETEAIEILRNEVYDQTTFLESPLVANILDKLTRPTVVENFDVSDLTDEQVRALRLNSRISLGVQ